MPTFALNFSRPGRRRSSRSTTPSCGSAATAYRAVQQATPGRGHCAGRPDRASWPTSGCSPAATSCRSSPSPRADDVTGCDVFDVSRRLRERGWLVPAYTFPANREDLAVLRVVCRNGFSHDLADLFFHDLRAVTQGLVTDPEAVGRTGPSGFHH